MSYLALKRYVFKTLKLDRYKKDYRLMIKFPRYLHETIMGLLLSDGGLERSSSNSNVRMNIVMSTKNYLYVFHLYNLFEPYIDSDLKVLDINIFKNSVKDKSYSTLRFKTISMPQLVHYYDIFYKKDGISGKMKKVVPIELRNNFSNISLAHLIMGDGNFMEDRNIIRIYTNSFIKSDVSFLSSVLKDNFFINNKVVHDRNNQYIIHIERDCVDLVREKVLPFMHPCMYYKLGISVENKNITKFKYLNIINDI